MYGHSPDGSKHCNLGCPTVNGKIGSLVEKTLQLRSFNIMMHDFCPEVRGSVDKQFPDISVLRLVHFSEGMVEAAPIPYNGVKFETILISPFLPVALRMSPREALLWPGIFCFSHPAHGDMVTVYPESMPNSTPCLNALTPVSTPTPDTAALMRQSTEKGHDMITAERIVVSAHLWSAVSLPGRAALTDFRIRVRLCTPAPHCCQPSDCGYGLFL